jgi:hypothetical protein
MDGEWLTNNLRSYPVVPDEWGLLMTIGEYLPWVLVDDILVESLGLTKAYDTLHSYSQLQDVSVILS